MLPDTPIISESCHGPTPIDSQGFRWRCRPWDCRNRRRQPGFRAVDDVGLYLSDRRLRGGDQQARRRGGRYGARGGAGEEGYGRAQGDPAAGVGADHRRCSFPFSAGAGGDRGGCSQDPAQSRQHPGPWPSEGCHPCVQGAEDSYSGGSERGIDCRTQGQTEAALRNWPGSSLRIATPGCWG